MSEFCCEFCKKPFSREALLVNHVCERKRRFLQRDDKSVRLAFAAYQRFYERAMRRRTPQTRDNFETSQFYTAFVRFARQLLDADMANPLGFVDFLIQVEAPLDRWTDVKYSGRYIHERNKNEKPLEAIERNIMLMQEWSVGSGEPWWDFFRKISPVRATDWIKKGRISPWMLFLATSVPDLLNRLSPEQMAIINEAIGWDSWGWKFWNNKIALHQAEVDEFRLILQEWKI
jgi:hypothetical protein